MLAWPRIRSALAVRRRSAVSKRRWGRICGAASSGRIWMIDEAEKPDPRPVPVRCCDESMNAHSKTPIVFADREHETFEPHLTEPSIDRGQELGVPWIASPYDGGTRSAYAREV
jgi:hypothetical protein